MAAPRASNDSSASSSAASSSSYRPSRATFFVPTLERLAATQLIQSLGGIQKAEKFILQNPVMEPPLKAALEYLHSLAAEAARFLLQGDTVTAEAMVQDNPAILYCVVKVKDRRENKVKGTLLQIAALAGDCNIQDKKLNEKDHGMVEKLKTYLPEEEAIKQLRATRPPGWEQETAARMQPYMDAITEFLNDIVNAQQAPDSNYVAFKTACEAHITKLRNSLASIPSRQSVIITGLIFDPQIFVNVLDKLLAKNINRLGGWWSDKSDLFVIVGFGSLQMCASACDIQTMGKGLYHVISQGQLPDRSLNFASGVPQSLTGLGDSFFIDILGWRADEAVWAGGARRASKRYCVGPWFVDATGRTHLAAYDCGLSWFKTMCEQKQHRCSVLCNGQTIMPSPTGSGL